MIKPTADLRVEAFDLLRGLCAAAVACYHMLGWLKVVELHTWGLYGVYIFFVLSGASMAVAYGERLGTRVPVTHYLALRYARLAPLYWLACGWMLGVGALGGASLDLSRVLLNATFLFGVANPGVTSLVTGGWSLGIEFVFYLVFPLLLVLARSRFRFGFVALAALAQLAQLSLALGSLELEQGWSAYTQFGSFIGYFMAGVVIGVLVLEGRVTRRTGAWWPWLACLIAIGLGSAPTARETLVGVRGAGLMVLCSALVWFSANVTMPSWLSPVSTRLGEASYALYLLHPIVYTVLSNRRLLLGFATSEPILFVALAVTVSFFAALIAYRWLESPLLKRAKRHLAKLES